MTRKTLKKTLIAFALLITFTLPSHAEQISVDREEYENLKKAVEYLMQQQKETLQKAEQAETKAEEATEVAEAAVEAAETKSDVGRWFDKTQIGGYGEMLYNNGTQRSDDSDNISNELDLQRFIFYISHEFTDKVRFFSETEIEHTRVGRSDDDPGAVEVEQAYVEWDFAQNHSVLAGLHIVPVGILNETHEPETFYGVERPRVESRIIPTTYRVNGVKFAGQIASGFSYDLGIHEGLQFDDGDLDIRDARQSGARANAEELAGTGRIKYTGTPGLELGITLQYQSDFTQDSTSNSNLRRDGLEPDNIDGLLTEAHAIWQYGNFGLRALYARWDIDDDVEELIDGEGRDEMFGWYVEPSWRFNDNWGVFARYTEIDERAGSSSGDADDSEESRFLAGVNYWLRPNVVFKADFQLESDEDRSSDDNDLDGFNLGVGWSF